MSREEKQKRSNQSLGRARLLYQRDLVWTFGFPMCMVEPSSMVGQTKNGSDGSGRKLPWIRLDAIATNDGSFVVDRDILRRSTLAASKLRYQFPKAMRRVFADPDRWLERLDQLLQAVKAFLHDGKTQLLDARNLLSAVAEMAPWNKNANQPSDPDLPPIVDAIRLAEAMRPKPTELPFDTWLSSASGQLHNVYSNRFAERTNRTNGLIERDFEMCLLVALRHELLDIDKLVRMGKLLSSPAVRFLHYPNPIQNISIWSERGRALATRTGKKLDKILQQPVSLPDRIAIRPMLIRLLARATTEKAGARKTIVDSVSILGLDNVLQPLEKVSNDVYAEERRLRSLVGQLESAGAHRSKPSRLFSKPLLAEVNVRPIGETSIKSVQAWQSALEFLSRGSIESAVIREVETFIAQSGEDAAVGLSLISSWQKAAERSDQDQVLNKDWGKFIAALNQVARQASGAQVARLIRPPEGTAFNACDSLVDSIRTTADLYGDRPVKLRTKKERLERLVALLKQLPEASIVELPRPMFDSVPPLIASQLSLSQVKQLLVALKQENDAEPVDHQEIESVFPFANGAENFFVLRTLMEAGDFDNDLLQPLIKLSDDRLGKTLVNRWITNRSWKRIQMFSGLVSLVPLEDDLKLKNARTEPTDWIERYPLSIRDSLIELNTVCENAEAVARKILAKDFGDEGKRQTEMRFLQDLLRSSELNDMRRDQFQNRLQHLEQFKQAEPVISDRRAKNLSNKLHERAVHEYEVRLRRHLLDRFCGELPGDLRPLLEERLKEPEFCMVAVGINKLDKNLRQFGNQLLRLTLRNQCFPEMEYAENRDFLVQLQDSGINVEPWMDLTRASTMAWKDGSSIALSFASSPMDYLLMGHHFQTCLSPHEINFFSTIANAIDVNKRVVYGRDANGKLLGRCLIALTENGQMVRFHSYSHDDSKAFGKLVDQFIDDLLGEMRATRASNLTQVPRLVADRWYNDGAVNVNGDASLGRALSLLRASAKVESPDTKTLGELRESLRAVIGQGESVGLTYEINEQVASWALDLFLKELWELNQPPTTIIRLAAQAFLINRHETAQLALESLSMKSLIRVFQRSTCDHDNCFGFHGIDNFAYVQIVIDFVGPSNGLKLLRASRKPKIRKDLDETSIDRRKLLASCHEQLGRSQLARKLRSRRPGT